MAHAERAQSGGGWETGSRSGEMGTSNISASSGTDSCSVEARRGLSGRAADVCAARRSVSDVEATIGNDGDGTISARIDNAGGSQRQTLADQGLVTVSGATDTSSGILERDSAGAGDSSARSGAACAVTADDVVIDVGDRLLEQQRAIGACPRRLARGSRSPR